MADQNAKFDDNRVTALTAHTGTAGTAETQRVVASTDGHVGVFGTVTSQGAPNAINTYGTSGTLSDGEVGTIVNYTSPANFKLRGFYATGTGQGYYTLEIGAGTVKYSYRTNITDKVAKLNFNNPESIASSTSLLLKVENENGDAQTFEGVVLGE
jgi:hypothetical protein